MASIAACRFEMLDLDLLFERHEILVHQFQGGRIQAFLAAEVVVDHPLVDATAFGDGVRAGRGQSLLTELAEGSPQNLRPGWRLHSASAESSRICGISCNDHAFNAGTKATMPRG